jgi:hypothetical protein
MRHLKTVIACAALWGSSCDLLAKLDPAPPHLAVTSVLPTDSSGRPLAIQVGGSSLAMDLLTRDALTALAECVDTITWCANKGQPVDDCVKRATQCQGSPLKSDTPCCPKACVDAYAQGRQAGADPVAAFDAVFFQSHDCFPEVGAMPGVGP